MDIASFSVGLMWHGDREARNTANLEGSRFVLAAAALKDVGIEPVAVVYNDDFGDEVRQQLLRLDARCLGAGELHRGSQQELDVVLRLDFRVAPNPFYARQTPPTRDVIPRRAA